MPPGAVYVNKQKESTEEQSRMQIRLLMKSASSAALQDEIR